MEKVGEDADGDNDVGGRRVTSCLREVVEVRRDLRRKRLVKAPRKTPSESLQNETPPKVCLLRSTVLRLR
jgi:hypothetical protein